MLAAQPIPVRCARNEALEFFRFWLNRGKTLALCFAVLLFGQTGSHPGLHRERLFAEAL